MPNLVEYSIAVNASLKIDALNTSADCFKVTGDLIKKRLLKNNLRISKDI